MSKNTKGHAGYHQATPKSSNIFGDFTRLRRRFKATVVILAPLGAMPVPAAEWIIRRGGLRDV